MALGRGGVGPELAGAVFATGVAIGSATPGTSGYACITIGFLADGWRGALVATITSWPRAFLVPLRAGYRQLEGRPWVEGAKWGVASADTGLLLAMVHGPARTLLPGGPEIALAQLTVLLLSRRISPAEVLALAALSGALFLR